MTKYMQIYNLIISDILSGKYNDTQKLKSEKEYAVEYSVSINTIRKALNNLIVSGYVVSRHGSGYYLSEHSNFNTLQLKSLYDIHNANKITSNLVEFQICQANDLQADKLNVETGCAIYSIKRIRSIDGKASLIENTIIPVQIFPTLRSSVFDSSFYNYIEEESEHKLDRAIKDISAIVATDEICQIFTDKKIGDPLLVIENYGFLTDGQQFEYSYNIHIDEKLSISVPKI